MTQSAIDAETESRLERQVKEMTSTLKERMDDYEDVLHGAVGLFAASPSVSREQWRTYVDTINLRENLPSIQALGFAPRLKASELDALLQETRAGNLPAYTVWPDGPRDELVPVLYSEPNSTRNQAELGFDMLAEPTRRAALDAARDLGVPAMSAKVRLVQETDADQPGFLLYLPLYRAHAPADTVEARRAALRGYVYAAFRMQDLIKAAFPSASNGIGLEIYDGLIAEEHALLYRGSALRDGPNIDGATVVDRPITVSNHSWILRFVVLPSFGAGMGQNQPTLILLGGVAISLLVSLIVLILGWNRARTAAINRRLEIDVDHRKQVEAQLRDSEQRFRDIAEVAGDWIWETDAEHRFTLFAGGGREHLTALGFAPDRAIGRTRWQISGVEDPEQDEFWRQHKATLSAGLPFRQFRYTLAADNGERLHMLVSGKPVFDSSGSFTGYRGTATDETGLVIALNRARQAEAVLQDAVDSISEGFIIFDHEDRFVMCNAAMRNLDANTAINHVPGVTFEETLRNGLATGRYQVEEAARAEWLAQRVRQHRAPASVVEIQLGDGRHILVSDRRMRSGGVAGLRVDITALKLAQQAASESEKLARDIIDSALDAFIQMDDAGHVLEWNPQAEAIFGWTREQAVGRPLTGLIVPDDLRSRHRDGIARFLRDGTGPILGRRIELDAVRRDGQRIKVELSVTALPRGASYVFNAFLRDITEKLAAEAHLRQVQKMDAVGQLTGGLAHDFNNLLGIIIGNLDLLAELSRDDPATSELAKDVLEAALHGADLTRRLLAFARRQPLQPQQLDLNEMISGLAKLLGRTLGINIGIKLDLSPDVWPARADRSQLEAALANLATNARDAMPKGGRIVIATRNEHCDRDYVAEHPDVAVGDYAIVEVSDTGTGMSPEVASRIFEPFFTTKEPGKGTGLGLSSVFGFVKQSGGHVNVYSEPGKGTAFQLYLPRAPANGAAQAVNGAPARPTLRGTESILAVEDNPKMRRILVKQLQDLGYRVVEADNAASALEILDRPGHIDLLLTDVVMPGLRDGFELAREAETRRPGLRVLLTSGFSETRFQDSEALNARRLLGKPYRKQDLARAVREALERQHG